jgi:hypothetical protein
VLRTKISMFAELWTKTRQVAELRTMRVAVRDALDALGDADAPGVDAATAILRKALDR